MPNWCNTCYKFHGPANDIDKLYDTIKTATDGSLTDTIENGFGDTWLGNILIKTGLKHTISSKKPENALSCRGIVMLGEKTDTTLSLSTDTAWQPMPQMWAVIIRKLNLNIEFSFSAEEPGNGLYYVYDPHKYNDFPEDIVIGSESDTDDNILDISGHYSEKAAIETINNALKKDCKTIDEVMLAIANYNNEHADCTDDYIGFYKINKIDSYDCFSNEHYAYYAGA